MVSTVPASHVDQGQGILSSCTSGVICTYHCCSVAEGLYCFFGGYDFFVDGCSLVKGLMAAAQVARVDAAPFAVARPAAPPEGPTPASAHGASRAPCAAERVAGPSARRRASGRGGIYLGGDRSLEPPRRPIQAASRRWSWPRRAPQRLWHSRCPWYPDAPVSPDAAPSTDGTAAVATEGGDAGTEGTREEQLALQQLAAAGGGAGAGRRGARRPRLGAGHAVGVSRGRGGRRRL